MDIDSLRWQAVGIRSGCTHTRDYRRNGPTRCDSSSIVRQDECETCFSHCWPHACVLCGAVRCKDHLAAHWTLCRAQTAAHTHRLARDVKRGHIYCGECDDYVYDLELEHRAPTALQEPELRECINVSTRIHHSLDRTASLRGLYNLGNTCFVNSVLQSILSSTSLARYFLADKHPRQLCTTLHTAPCLCCELDSIVRACHSGHVSPFSTHAFLFALWSTAHHLAGYEQQDAQELYIAVMNVLHERLIPPQQHRSANSHCDCIAHDVFSGTLLSVLQCQTCGTQSRTHELFWDVSLHVTSTQTEGPPSLESCLARFTSAESLDALFPCDHCQSPQPARKSFSFDRLPQTLVFHIKRFNAISKIGTFVEFPLRISITPDQQQEQQKQCSAVPADHPRVYRLIAVVIHHGTIASGHYTAYVFRNDEWFHVDDAAVTLASVASVLASSAYLLFYEHIASN